MFLARYFNIVFGWHCCNMCKDCKSVFVLNTMLCIMSKKNDSPSEGKKVVYSKYITRNGKRINHPTGGVFRFEVPIDSKK